MGWYQRRVHGILKMKRTQNVTSSRRKCRKNHYTAASSERRKIMSVGLSKALREKYGVRSLPIKRGDEVSYPLKRVKGVKRERVQAKVTTVYRRRWHIFVDKKTKEKQNGQTVNIPVVPSTCRIEKLLLNKDRKEYIDRKTKAAEKLKNKNTGA